MTQLFGGKFYNSKICIINLINLLSCSIEFHREKSLSLFLFQCTVLILKLTSHKDSYFQYNCLYHIIVFPIENVTKKETNSVLFSPINDFELQISKLRDIKKNPGISLSEKTTRSTTGKIAIKFP